MRVLWFLVGGALLGGVFRLWMRFVSTEHEFSWSGTTYIVGVFAVLGLMAGLVEAARRRGRTRGLIGLRAAGAVLALGLFMAAGATTFPTIVPGALALARSDWHRLIRIALAILAVVAAAVVVLSIEELTLGHRLVALAGYLGLCTVEAALLARILAPSLPAGSVRDAPLVMRVGLVGVPLLAAFALVIMAIGIPGG